MANTEVKSYTNLSNAKRAAVKALALFKLPADQPVEYRDVEQGKIMPVILRRAGEDAQPFIGLAHHGFRVEDQLAEEITPEAADALAPEAEGTAEEITEEVLPLPSKTASLAALEAVAPEPEAPVKAAKAPKVSKAQRMVEEAAAGVLPEKPAASARNASYAKRFDALEAMAQAGDVEGLKAATFGKNTYGLKASRYRDALLVWLGEQPAAQQAAA